MKRTVAVSANLARMLVILAVVVCADRAALAQPAPFTSETVAVAFDSGWVAAPRVGIGEGGPQVIFAEVLDLAGTPWLRLHFDQLVLSGSRAGGDASILRITSLKDGAYQRLDHISAEQWNGYSAFFNGDALLIEIIAHPGTPTNRVTITTVTAGLPEQADEGGIASICFGVDERQLSNNSKDARTSGGCTSFLIGHYCLLTAGHCHNFQSVEFNVPLSNPDGSPNFSHPDDQYAVDMDSRQIQNNPCGNDWMYFGVFPNSNTGLTPLQAQGDSYQLAAAAPPPNGQPIRIRGYGTTSSPVPPTWNKAQKEHSGPYLELAGPGGTLIGHQADTTGGNSGSAVYDHTAGLVIGIHTCGGCGQGGGTNKATAIHQNNLQNALANPQGVCTWPDPVEPCEGDFDGDGKVGVSDLLILLAAWGPCPGCDGDLTGDGNVGVADLLALLSLWGDCP